MNALPQDSRAELRTAMAAVMSGRRYVSQQIADRREERLIRDPRRLQARALSYSQREVLQLLAEGLTMKEAAAELNITPRTIAFHKYRIMAENGLRNNSEFVFFAVKQQGIRQRH